MPEANEQSIRSYYDEFAARYEKRRRPNDPHGYHALVDDLEVDFTRRFCEGKDLLEVGCGTGLLLEQLAPACKSAKGVDVSEGMLELARERGLDAQQGSATSLPFESESFDVVCSFKVLAHVPEIAKALAEMVRVTRPGGYVLAEFYNPISLRALAKRIGPPGAISDKINEDAVYTRYDLPWRVARMLPPQCRLAASRGVRIVTPVAAAMRVPLLRTVLRNLEWTLCDSPLAALGGFWIAAIHKLR